MDPKAAQPNPSAPTTSAVSQPESTPAPTPQETPQATPVPEASNPAPSTTPATLPPTTPAVSEASSSASPATPPASASIPPVVSSAPADKPKAKPMKKILLILLGVLILLGIGGGGYFVLSQKQAAPQKAKVAPTPTEQPTPTPNPTADWQTFTGNGFTFMYPKNWVMKKNTLAPYDTYFYDPATGSPTGNGGSSLYKDNLDVVIISSTQTIDAYIASLQAKQTPALTKDFQTKQISLNGKQVAVYHQGGQETVGWYIPSSNGSMIVDFGPLATDPAQDSVEMQVIKTFKFIDPVTSVVQNYYLTYRDCLDKLDKAAMAGTISNQTTQQQACPFNQNGQLTTSLATQLAKATAFDPVLCAQNIPLNMTFDAPVLNNTRASIVVHTLWVNSSPGNITVGLDQVGNAWKISSITCQR